MSNDNIESEAFDVPEEYRDQKRVESIYEKRDRVENFLSSNFDWTAEDEEMLFNLVKVYYISIEQILSQTERGRSAITAANIGAITREDVFERTKFNPPGETENSRGRSRSGTKIKGVDGEVLEQINGLENFIQSGPVYKITVLKPGNSRSSGPQEKTGGIPIPRRLSVSAFRTINSFWNDLDLEIQVDENNTGHLS